MSVPPAELAGHAFLRGMPAGQVAPLAQAATLVSVLAGHRFFDEGGPADAFWLIVAGHVALDLHVPGRSRLIMETVGDGGVVGISWLAPQREWQFGAEAVWPTAAFRLDAAAVTQACDRDPSLGYQVTRRLMTVTWQRLHSARIRMLDLYGAAGGAG